VRQRISNTRIAFFNPGTLDNVRLEKEREERHIQACICFSNFVVESREAQPTSTENHVAFLLEILGNIRL
jgi:hypothetical protein